MSDAGVMAALYNLVLFLASPLLLLYLFHRIVVKGKSREGLPERLGWAPRLPMPGPGGRVWMHAVSAGEMVSAAAIARKLAQVAPDVEVIVSTTTPAGRQQAERLLPGALARFYFPFDFLPCVALALRRTRPTAIAPVETEIWPNWLWLSRVLRVRSALVNGQFADRGFRGARKARPLYRWALGCLDALWMQSGQAAERALFLGAPGERVRVVGNAKFEQQAPVPRPEIAAEVSEALALSEEHPLWVVGSTHPGEEEQVLDAFTAAREREPRLRLLLAPRHVERAAEVAALLEARSLSYRRRSGGRGETVDVLLLDTMGELAGLYALADVVFVGGSLVPIGGHDILQPLMHGKPTLVGPHMHNQQDVVDLALAEGAVLQVESAADLGSAVVRVLADAALRGELRAAGDALLLKNAGAALQCANLLARLARGETETGIEHVGTQAG